MKNPKSSPWIAHVKPRPTAKVRLFCFPYAGGSALVFRKWTDSLPGFIEVFPVEIPGRGGRMREQPFTSMMPLVDALAVAIGNHLEKPFALFGHSMGATVSFELAHRLHSMLGVQPVHLFFSGRRAPQVPRREPPTFNLSRDQFVETLRDLEGTPEEVLANQELLEMILPTLRADFELIQTHTYVARPRLACPVTVLGGMDDREVTREDLEAWREHASGQFRLHSFPGNHFFLHQSEALVLQTIARALFEGP